MNSFIQRTLSLSLTFFSVLSLGLSFPTENGQWEKTSESERAYQAIDTLTVGAYNVENLFEEAVVPPKDTGFQLFDLIAGLNNVTKPIKPVAKIKGIARAILANHYDILVVEEVENIETLELLNQYYLQDLYKPFLIEGNDGRGIDVGYLVKKDLPFFIEHRTNKNEVWNDPTNDNQQFPLFSRDLPELHVRLAKNDNPLFILLGTHFKSKISRKDDPESRILRKAQVERAAEIMLRLEKEYNSRVPLFLGGDFNGVVNQEKEFAAFKNVEVLYDAFDVIKPSLTKDQRFTHVYFPKGKPFERSQLDGFMATAHGRQAVARAFPYRYVDGSGNPLPIPTTYEEKERSNPSDHYPVVVELNMHKLVE